MIRPTHADVAPSSIRLERPEKAVPRQVGLAKIDITPQTPILLSGYAGRSHVLTAQVSQKIWARAIAVNAGDQAPAVIIAVENCGIPARIRDDISEQLYAKFQIPSERLTICSTHTHSGPMLSGALENLTLRDFTTAERDAIDNYTHKLIDQLVQVAADALAQRQPSYLHFGRGKVSFAVNRRGGTVTDHDLPVLVVTGADGRPRGFVTNYACHCVSADAGLDISGDWAGCAATDLETRFPDATALVLIGCGADQNPAQKGGFPASQQQGKLLADEVMRVISSGLPTIDAPLLTTSSRIKLDFAAVPDQEELKRRQDLPGVVGYQAKKSLLRLERGESLPQTLDYPVQTWTFGKNLAMVFLADEVVVDYVLALKKVIDPERLWVTAYSNDVACYIPSDRILKEGGYEAADAMDWYGQPSPLAAGTEARILEEVERQLGDLSIWKHNPNKTGGTWPRTPAESIAAMKVRDGFRVEVVAAEPLVVDPVAIDFGPDGKLWVAEMRDYPEGVPGTDGPGGVIRFLEDIDGDGQYDRSTLFLDKVPFPTGVTAWRNGVLICSAPDVIYAEDTDGDGIADVRTVVLSGFETHNYQARVNSISLGLDNWMYGAAGIFGGKVNARDRPPVDIQNRDFRFRPDEALVEGVSGRTQQGRARDDWGNWFGSTNSELLLFYPTTDHYYTRSPRVPVPPPQVLIATDSQLYPSGQLVQFTYSGPSGRPTSVCGLGIYRDSLLGEEVTGNAFLCEPVNQLVHRRTLHPRNSVFSASRGTGEEESEFISSTDNWFRPVQVRTGPDGALYVVDMYRYVIEHPRFISEEVKSQLDVRAGETRGRIYRVLPVGAEPRPVPHVRSMSNQQLVSQLDASNGTLRDQAHLELLWRNASDVASDLKQLALQGATPQGRLHALAVLDGLNVIDRLTMLSVLRQERHPGVQRTAIRVAEKFLDVDAEIRQQLIQLADSSDPQVRLQLAYSLGATSSPDVVPSLSRLMLIADGDAYLQSAVLSSVTPRNIEPLVATLRQSTSELKRLSPVLTLAGELADPAFLYPVLKQICTARSAAEEAQLLKLLVSIRMASDRRKLELSSEQQSFWEEQFARARELVLKPDAPAGVRVAAIACLPLQQNHERAIETLLTCLEPHQPVAVQDAAVRALASIQDDTARAALFASLRGLSPTVQTSALNAICSQKALTLELLTRLEERSLPRTLIDAIWKQQLTGSPHAEIRQRAELLFARPTNEELETQLAAARSADLQHGDRERGRELFMKNCAGCHRSQQLGHDVGPDLDALTDRSRDYLVTAIIDPNAAVDRRYATYTASLKDGRVLSGILASDGENSMTLKAKDGVKQEILRADLDELSDTGKSMMPEGLSREIGLEELRHLLAFLNATNLEGKGNLAGRPIDQQFESIREIARLMSDVKLGTGDEYRVIPPVFHVAIAAGKRNDGHEVVGILDMVMPLEGEPLRDWEAVVIGGGIVNGISQAGVWPTARLRELIPSESPLALRWARMVKLADGMANNEQVPTGTRYDALRIVATLPFSESRETLQRYLQPGTNGELQQGAVSGLADVPDAGASVLLATCYPHLPESLRPFALDGLIRVDGAHVYLLDAVAAGMLAAEDVPADAAERLSTHDLPGIRDQAARLLKDR